MRPEGIFFNAFDALGERLRDRAGMEATRARVWQERGQFTFDDHVPELLAFFRSVIRHAGSGAARPLPH